MNKDTQSTLLSFAPLIDGLLITLAGWVSYYIRWGRWSMPDNYLFVLILGTALMVVLLPLSGAYQSWRGRTQAYTLGHALPALVLVSVILAVIGTLTKTSADFSRLWMAYWFILSLVLLFMFRWLSVRLQRKGGGIKRRILIVGDGAFAATVARNIDTSAHSTHEVIGFVSDGALKPASQLPAPVIGELHELESLVLEAGDDLEEVWIAPSDLESDHHKSVQQMLRSTCLTVRFVPDLKMLALFNHVPSEIAGMTVIDLNASPLEGHNILLKTSFDKLFSALALVILSPLLCLISLAIKMDSPGPVIYRQQRHGWDGKIIEVLKFRSMAHLQSTDDGERQAIRNDPRVTPIGRVLRRTSLDELPQFINVLRGDMSVVGPRPHPVSLNQDYVDQIDAYMQRHRVKPGITGWAQVHGLRGETDTLNKMQKRLDYDLYYIENWSLWLDVKIIMRTVAGAWMGENAY